MIIPQNLINVLECAAADFHPVVPFDNGKDKLLPLDFTTTNTELTDAVLSNTNLFTQYVGKKLQSAGARYGIGGYGEHRTIYKRSIVFDGEEPRRLHLGTDIWGPPYTKVMAPLDGIVHSFGFHPALGNYGAVIIVAHYLQGVSFYTLYGHLSRNSIKNVHEGDVVKKGDVFAEFGIPQENGQWPPHLHFQVMRNMQGWKGDYPGVCAFSEKDQWLQNCIDPDLILNLARFI